MDTYRQTSFGPIHQVDYGGTGPIALLVHGLGGSTTNWDALAPGLTSRFHVIALDLPGFGLTPPGRDYRLETHRSAVESFIEDLGVPVCLIGNSTGALVAEMVAAQRPDLVQEMILIAPATPPRWRDPRRDWKTTLRLMVEAIPVVGELYLRSMVKRHTVAELVMLGLESVSYQPGRVPLTVIEATHDLYRIRRRLPWAYRATNRTATSIAAHYARRRRFLEMVRAIKAPALVIQGVFDPIVSPSAVEWLCGVRKDWELIQLPDTGHTPQLDAPLRTLEVIDRWLDRQIRPTIADPTPRSKTTASH